MATAPAAALAMVSAGGVGYGTGYGTGLPGGALRHGTQLMEQLATKTTATAPSSSAPVAPVWSFAIF
jgi:hypothetical protein